MALEVAPGWNNSANLEPWDQEPAQWSPITYPETLVGGDGTVTLVGKPTIELTWNELLEVTRETILDQAGLDTTYGNEVASAQVTLRILDNDDTYINVNAVIMLALRGNNRRSVLGWSDLTLTASLWGTAS